jgi:hypothetical protein
VGRTVRVSEVLDVYVAERVCVVCPRMGEALSFHGILEFRYSRGDGHMIYLVIKMTTWCGRQQRKFLPTRA